MEFKFTQHEVESRFYKILEYGDETEIASRVGTGQSYISQMYNPDDPRESNLHKALKEIAAEMDISPERGCKMLRLFNEFIERGMKETDTRCIQQETRRLNKELREFYDADMCDEPLELQIEELADVERQARELRKAKEQQLAKAKEKETIQETYFNSSHIHGAKYQAN